MKKKLLAIGLGTAMTLAAFSASAASLTITNNNANTVQVNCNGITGVPITGNGGTLTLPYLAIYLKFGLHHRVNCSFIAGSQTGSAVLQISNSMATAQITKYAPKSGVTITPVNATTQPVSNITVTINQLNK